VEYQAEENERHTMTDADYIYEERLAIMLAENVPEFVAIEQAEKEREEYLKKIIKNNS
jgi:GTPase